MMNRENIKRNLVPVGALIAFVLTYHFCHSGWLVLSLVGIVLGALGYFKDLLDLRWPKAWQLAFLAIFLVSSVITAKNAAPQKLSLHSKDVEKTKDGFTVNLTFRPSKNENLARIVFEAQILGETDSRILDLKPIGPSITWSNGKHLADDGRFIGMFYSLPGLGFPKVLLTTSGPATIEFRGNHNLKPLKIKIE